MKAKIVILNERDITHPRAGGAEVHLFEIFGRLARQGYDVTLLCASYPGAKKTEILEGIRIHRLANRYLYYLLVPLVYRRWWRRERWDLLIEDLNKLPLFSPLYTRGPRLVIVHHLFGATAFRQVPLAVAVCVYLAEKLIPWTYQPSPFVAVSSSTREDLIHRGIPAHSIRVIPNGVNHSRYHAGAGSKPLQPLVLSLGRVEPYKRLDVLLHAMVRVRQEVPPARLTIAGAGDALPRLKRLANHLGLGPWVDFRGFVSEEEKVTLFRQAHVMVNPSEKEGWGLTVLEASACGTPVVASDVPGLRDSVVHGATGLLVPYGDIGHLARAIITILTDAALRQRLAAGGMEWAKKFDWDQIAEEMRVLIDRCAGSHGERCGKPGG